MLLSTLVVASVGLIDEALFDPHAFSGDACALERIDFNTLAGSKRWQELLDEDDPDEDPLPLVIVGEPRCTAAAAAAQRGEWSDPVLALQAEPNSLARVCRSSDRVRHRSLRSGDTLPDCRHPLITRLRPTVNRTPASSLA